MSPKKSNYEAAASIARDRARKTAAQVKPAAAQVRPLAQSTQAAARRGVRRTRAWAAPQVERTGQVLQDSVAPKVSALLSSAAQRLDPAKPPRRRWRKVAGIATLTAVGSAIAAAVRNSRKLHVSTPAADVTATTGTSDEQRTSADANADAEAGQQVRAS
jgi:hypothetical protein